VEVCEENLAGTQEGILGRERLFDLQDHVGAGVEVGRVANDAGARFAELPVGDACAVAGAGLDDDGVAALMEGADAGRVGGDASLSVLDFPRDAYDHGWASRPSVDWDSAGRGRVP